MPTLSCPLCPPRQRTLRLVVTADTDDLETGGWCDDCALPSVLTIPLTARCRHGWPLGRFGTVQLCDECGARSTSKHRRTR